jgi:hypothetical protein
MADSFLWFSGRVKAVFCPCPTTRLESTRPFAMTHGAEDRCVFQFRSVSGPAQKESAAAHIPTPNEIDRELQTLAEGCDEHVDVFAGADASEEDGFAVTAEFGGELLGVLLNGAAIANVVMVDVDGGEGAQIVDRKRSVGVDQASVGGDDEDARGGAWRLGEGASVSDFAAEIQAAEESKDVADRNESATLQTTRQVEPRAWIKD